MKFSFKIFSFAFLVIVLSLIIGGFFIIESTFQRDFKLKVDSSLRDNNLLVNFYETLSMTSEYNSGYILNQIKNAFHRNEVFVGGMDQIKWGSSSNFVKVLQNNEQGYQVIEEAERYYLQVVTRVKYDEVLYFENLVDITSVYHARDKNYYSYCFIVILVSVLAASVMGILAIYITRPIKKLERMTQEMAQGNYQIQIRNVKKEMKSPELIRLAIRFNEMASKTATYTNELKEYGKRQEEFVARFSHELKTPLTSIIGYADFLRTYNVSLEESRSLMNYIYKEGRRLEELSLHLLNLNLLKKEHIVLEQVDTKEFGQELFLSLRALVDKYQVQLELELEDCLIWIEPALMKSLIYNLVDNACKADTDRVIVRGEDFHRKYILSVIDFGKGIPADSLERVTEPFYMVDKSRARKQGGSGLGLSLVKEIAQLHQTELKIQSKLGKGTVISLEVEVCDED